MPKIITFLFLLSLSAQSNAVSCDASTVNRDKGMANDLSASKAQRFERMKLIYNDIRQLKKLIANPKQMPRSFYRHCFDEKNKAFSAHAQNAQQGLSDSAEFHALLGDYLYLMGKKIDALNSYDKAVTSAPRNAEFKLKAFELFQTLEAKRIRAITVKNDRARATEEFKQKIIIRLDAILSTPNVSPKVRSQAYVYKALALATDERLTESEQAWIQALKEMPNNTIALSQLSKFYINKAKRPQKAIPHLQRLSREDPKEENFELYAQTSYQANEHHETLAAANSGLKKFPKNNELKVYKAWALINLDRHEEAKIISNSLAKILPKHPVARHVRAQIKSHQAKQIAESSPGQAILLIKEAISLFPKSEEFRIQMAELIVSHAQQQNYLPKNTTIKDFDYALSTLGKIIHKNELSSTLASVGTALYAHSSNPKQGKSICDKLYKNRLNTTSMIINCAIIYNAAKHISKSQKLLDNALQNPMLEKDRDKILKAMATLGL